MDYESTASFLSKRGIRPGHRYRSEIRGRVRDCVFSRIGGTGWMICHEVGEPDMQSSWAVKPEQFVDDPETLSQLTTLYGQEMAKRGCHGYSGFYLNAAQLEPEIEQTLNAAGEVFPLLAEALETNTVADRLQCAPQRDYFRRMVR